jgi:hypothetical protein
MIGWPETHPVKKVIGFTEEMIQAVESWRAKQKPVPNLSEAIRRLVELALSVDKPQAHTSARTATKAKSLAGRAIDEMADPELYR